MEKLIGLIEKLKEETLTNQEAIEELKLLESGQRYDTEYTDFDCFKLAIKALEQHDKEHWIPIGEKLPDANTDVLITFREYMEYSKKYRYGTCKAIYIPVNTIKSEDLWSYCDNDDLEVYDEKEDIYYAKDGWYEVIEHWDDYSNVAINCEVIAWKPTPEPYKED